ncbi:MAG: GIY-YIG nuclease family protein [Terracidiphilus sp.]|jgi:hypothetical protein
MDDEDNGGIVYILKNEAMPGYVKVGRAANLKERMSTLDTSGVPLPFECYYARRVSNAVFVEGRLHSAFSEYRARKSREFFKILPERVKAALEIASGEEVAVDERTVVETADDIESLAKAKTRRPVFRFSMIEVKPGTVLVHINNPQATCIVYDDRNVTFEGEVMSLSRSAGIVEKRRGVGESVAGTDYWTLNGATLWDLRNQAEESDSE